MSLKVYQPRIHDPLPGEISMKGFCFQEAEKEGVTPLAIYRRIGRGGYPGMIIRRVNARVVFVKPVSKETQTKE